MTHDETLKTQTRTAMDLLAKYHTSIAGTIIADEYITDLSPVHGSELCIAAEMMFSLAYVYQFLGDNDLADWAERTAYNAFPVSVSPDWWSHQYIHQENQVGTHTDLFMRKTEMLTAIPPQPWSRNLTTADQWVRNFWTAPCTQRQRLTPDIIVRRGLLR